MANLSVKFITTVEERLSALPVVNGQLILVSDIHTIYMDKDDKRIPFNQIIELATEQDRLNYTKPIRAFYFVEETCVLWRYDRTNGWQQLTSAPNESIVFTTEELLPEAGKANVLYITESDMYRWMNDGYVKFGELLWEVI